MMEFFRCKLIVFLVVLSFTLQSCTGIENLVSSNKSNQTSSKTRPSSQASSRSPAHVENLAQKHIRAGNYQKMINTYNYEHLKQPRDVQLMQGYARSLNSIKTTADNAYEQKNYASAGRIYYILQKNYGKFNPIVQMLSFNNAYLSTRLFYCKKNLSIQGFQEYRKGNINSALVSWQDVLEIDPNNTEIKEAIEKAKLQQKNLAQKR